MNAKYVGISDDDTCEKCGKTNLKRVIVLNIEGDTVRYGTDCAARALMGDNSAKNRSNVTYRAKIAQRVADLRSAGKTEKEVREDIWLYFGTADY